MDPDSLSKAAKALSKPLVKLLDVVSSGAGAVSSPVMKIINAHADGRAALIREGYRHRLALLQDKNRREVSMLAAGEEIPTEDGEELDIEVIFQQFDGSSALAARSMATEQEIKRHANVMTIAGEAADRIGDQVSDDPVDADWIARFFTSAQDVSNKKLQELWGSLLAGEVSSPGTVPIRTLDILKNLTTEEAKSLQALTARLTGTAYLPYGKHVLPGREQHVLQDAGLLDENYNNISWSKLDGTSAPSRPPGRFGEGPPGVAELRYPSGHVVRIETRSTVYKVSFLRLRPSAVPLAELAYSDTDVEYLQGVVNQLNSEPYFKASLLSPESEVEPEEVEDSSTASEDT